MASSEILVLMTGVNLIFIQILMFLIFRPLTNTFPKKAFFKKKKTHVHGVVYVVKSTTANKKLGEISVRRMYNGDVFHLLVQILGIINSLLSSPQISRKIFNSLLNLYPLIPPINSTLPTLLRCLRYLLF